MTGLDLDARHLAFGWNYIKDDGGIGLQLDIRVDRTSAARGRLLATLNTEPFLWLGATAPSLDTGSVVWGYIGSRNRGSSAFRVVADGSSALTSQQISPRTQSLSSARSVLYADVSRPNLDSGSSCVGSSNDFEPDETIGLGCAIVRQPFVGE